MKQSIMRGLNPNWTVLAVDLTVLLTDQVFPAVLDSSTSDLVADFFVPALRASVRYDRGVGFFSSGWLRLAAAGMVEFAANSGRARWVTSPILGEKDWQALQLGDAARYDEVLRRALERNLDDLERALKEETLSALAWLVADGILGFKLALPRNKLERGEFHDKFGIFTDAGGNRVSFNGSYNDSIQGARNYESIKIFCSWQPAFADLVRADTERFEKLLTSPWKHQREAIEAWEKNNRIGLMSMATGSGKTRTAVYNREWCMQR